MLLRVEVEVVAVPGQALAARVSEKSPGLDATAQANQGRSLLARCEESASQRVLGLALCPNAD